MRYLMVALAAAVAVGALGCQANKDLEVCRQRNQELVAQVEKVQQHIQAEQRTREQMEELVVAALTEGEKAEQLQIDLKAQVEENKQLQKRIGKLQKQLKTAQSPAD